MSNKPANPDAARAKVRRRRVLSSCVLLYPLLMHVLIVYQLQGAALLGLAAVGLTATVVAVLDGDGWQQALPYLVIAVAAGAALAAGNAFALYLPSIVVNLVFAGTFARTLRAGDTPMIERFMRLHHGEQMVPELVRYARQLTYIWAAFCAVMAITSAVLMIFTSLEAWSLFANVINYALVAALFIGQFVYGYLRYRAIAPAQIVPTAARMARRAASGGPGNR
jgi:uncharacterized membrane protein